MTTQQQLTNTNTSIDTNINTNLSTPIHSSKRPAAKPLIPNHINADKTKSNFSNPSNHINNGQAQPNTFSRLQSQRQDAGHYRSWEGVSDHRKDRLGSQ